MAFRTEFHRWAARLAAASCALACASANANPGGEAPEAAAAPRSATQPAPGGAAASSPAAGHTAVASVDSATAEPVATSPAHASATTAGAAPTAPSPATSAAPARQATPAAAQPPAPTASAAPSGVGKVLATLNGLVSYYGPGLAGLPTANGERFNPKEFTMAHPSLPFGTLVRVFNPKTLESVVVRVNDRGPFVRGRIADLSHAAAEKLRMISSGVSHLTLEVLGKPEPDPRTTSRR